MAASWRDLARCRGMDTDLFFPEPDVVPTVLEVCAVCPVRDACLDDAVAVETREGGGAYGIRGGMIASHRARLLSRMKRSGTILSASQFLTKEGA